jgi:hypothetical protein
MSRPNQYLKRKGKISNEIRRKLIEMIYVQDYSLKDASEILNLNYSSAKTIARIYRKEKRFIKKISDRRIMNDIDNDDQNNIEGK